MVWTGFISIDSLLVRNGPIYGHIYMLIRCGKHEFIIMINGFMIRHSIKKKDPSIKKQHEGKALQKKDVLHLRLRLVECEAVTFQELLDAAKYLKPQEYQDMVTERSCSKRCGYPICRRIPMALHKGKYKISLSQRKVLDLHELQFFCSSTCAMASREYKKNLSMKCHTTCPLQMLSLRNQEEPEK
jgi:hypothetical protein